MLGLQPQAQHIDRILENRVDRRGAVGACMGQQADKQVGWPSACAAHSKVGLTGPARSGAWSACAHVQPQRVHCDFSCVDYLCTHRTQRLRPGQHCAAHRPTAGCGCGCGRPACKAWQGSGVRQYRTQLGAASCVDAATQPARVRVQGWKMDERRDGRRVSARIKGG